MSAWGEVVVVRPSSATAAEVICRDRALLHEGVHIALRRWTADAAEIEAVWRALEARTPAAYFRRFEWYRCTIALAGQGGREADHLVGIAKVGDTPVGVLPLRRARRSISGVAVSALELPIENHYRADWLIDCERAPTDLVTRFVETLTQRSEPQWDCVFLPKVPEGANISRSLGEGRWPHLLIDSSEWVDYLTCAEDYEVKLKQLSKNFRACLRKTRNRLRAAPALEVRWYSEGAELDWALDEFARIESSGWKGNGVGDGILRSAEGEARYRARAHALQVLGACRVALLFVGGKAIAGQWAAVEGNTISLLKIGYDETAARFAPGNMLLEWLLRMAIADPQIQCVDLTSSERWHANWKPERYALSNIYFFRRTPRGLLAYAATALKLRVRARLGRGRSEGVPA